MVEATEQQVKARRRRRTVTGVVTTAHKTPATLRVEVEFLVRHRHYNKYVRHRTILHVHDPQAEAKLGDRVEVVECRPVSKTKRWRLAKVVDRSAGEAR